MQVDFANLSVIGVYGDVVRVKILFNKKDTALIQFNHAQQAQTGTSSTNDLKSGGHRLEPLRSKHFSTLKGLCQLRHMCSRVRLRLITFAYNLSQDFQPLQKLSRISQKTASVITKEHLLIKNSANFPKMNAILTDENSVLNSPKVLEKVGLMISKCFSSTRVCAWGGMVPLTYATKLIL